MGPVGRLGSQCSQASYIFMGGTRLKFESWKVKNHTQNASQHHFYCFLKDIWTLKSDGSLKSPIHAFNWNETQVAAGATRPFWSKSPSLIPASVALTLPSVSTWPEWVSSLVTHWCHIQGKHESCVFGPRKRGFKHQSCGLSLPRKGSNWGSNLSPLHNFVNQARTMGTTRVAFQCWYIYIQKGSKSKSLKTLK